VQLIETTVARMDLDVKHHFNIGKPFAMIEFMDCIEVVLGKGPSYHYATLKRM
jgi:hypothetical protein